MNKSRSVSRMSVCLCLLLGPCLMQTEAAAVKALADAVGREDPFAALDAAPKPVGPAPIVESNEPPPDLYLESVVLRFLDASSLQNVLLQMRTPHGAVSINKANNSVVLCDTRENLDKMVAEIKKADRTPQQVMVEVVILDVQLKNDSEIGINWDLLSDKRYDFGYRQNFTASRLRSTPETAASTTGTADTIGNATAFNTVGSGGDISVIFGTVRNVLHLVQERRNANILATPRTLVLSGQSATIEAVEQIPYKQVSDTAAGGQGALTSTVFKDVGVKLEVKATVTDGNDILLTVKTEQSVQTGTSQDGVPIVDKRTADTSLLLRDSQTVIMGGLRRDEKTKQVNQVPLLGDLPLIGFLFKSTTLVTTKSELVVLLSPRLNRGEPVPASVAARRESIRREDWLSSTQENDMDSPSKGD